MAGPGFGLSRHSRPCPTWRGEACRSVRINNSRASGVGRGQFREVVDPRAMRGRPSKRHGVIGAGNAASKGGATRRHSSTVRLVKASPSSGRV